MNYLTDIFLDRRGYSPEYLEAINRPGDDYLLGMDDMRQALHDIYLAGEEIVVVSDFDTDGLMSGIIGYAGLAELGFNVSLYSPDAARGYGIGMDSIIDIQNLYPRAKAIITADVGMSANGVISYAKVSGFKVLVTDHHLPDGKLPEADVIVNPCHPDDSYEFKTICGAYVLWKVLYNYASVYSDTRGREQIRRLRLFAGIGTVSDMMPVLYENRDLVKDSLAICQLLYNLPLDFLNRYFTGSMPYRQAFLGFKSLLMYYESVNNITGPQDLDLNFYAFNLSPLFNSLKRLEKSSSVAFNVFFAPAPGTSFEDRYDYLTDLYLCNIDRKALVAEYLAELLADDQPYAPYIYLSHAPAGILGLLATKLISSSGCPTLVLRQDDGGEDFTGSGRTPAWFPGLSFLRDNGQSARGHENAFGVTIKDKAGLNHIFHMLAKNSDELRPQDMGPQYDISFDLIDESQGDAPLDIPLLLDFMSDLNRLGPFGKGFEAPQVRFRFSPGVNFTHIGQLGKEGQHLKIILPYGLIVLMWDAGDRLSEIKDAREVEIVGTLNLNHYQDQTSLQVFANQVQTV